MNKPKINFIVMSVLIILCCCTTTQAQIVKITGIVLDSLKSMGIYNAKVKLIEYPQCTTRTISGGKFTLTGSITGILERKRNGSAISTGDFSLRGSTLVIKNITGSFPVVTDVFGINGARIYHAEKSASSSGALTFNNLWSTAGIYFIKVKVNENTYRMSSVCLNEKSGISNFLMEEKESKAAKSNATYTLEITANGYVPKRVRMASLTGSADSIKLAVFHMDTIISGVGTGKAYKAQNVTNVTGGGAFPDISNAYTCNCDGTGATDASSCLQTALNTAGNQKTPLLIPYTSGFYRITRPLLIRGSVIGIGAGMPKIKQVNAPDQKNFITAAGMTGWIFNIHLIGTNANNYPPEFPQDAHNIDLNEAGGVTIKNCRLENPVGDCIYAGWNGSKNILIDNNTLIESHRCALALVGTNDRIVFINNVIVRYFNSLVMPAIDFEPNNDYNYISNVEIAYNMFATWAWAVTINDWSGKSRGGNIYVHHNYGDWRGTGLDNFFCWTNGARNWSNIVVTNNEEGNVPPP
jgi:hypothetical protein